MWTFVVGFLLLKGGDKKLLMVLKSVCRCMDYGRSYHPILCKRVTMFIDYM